MVSRMRRLCFSSLLVLATVGCGSSTTSSGTGHDAGSGHDTGVTAHDAGRDGATQPHDGSAGDTSTGSHDSGHDATRPLVDGGACGACPVNYTCGTANGTHVCRAPSGIPLFSNVYVILMENTTLASLTTAIADGDAPNLKSMGMTYASGSQYHGVAHPSLPNYIALTSGEATGSLPGCDCKAMPEAGTCGALNCNSLLSSCSCDQSVTNLADQIEGAGLSWMDFGEDMGTPCNLVDSPASSPGMDAGNYAVRHNPFLYYDDILTTSRCADHIVDFKNFNPASPPSFTYIAPNLIDDMHNPVLTTPPNTPNVPDGDKWIGPQIATLVASAAYKKGGLIVVVWDEDDNSGVSITGTTDDPVPIYVLSPFAKSGGYVSATMANHYSLLATIEDGLGLTRLGSAASASPLTDYFPAN
jgi:hypothetical protein